MWIKFDGQSNIIRWTDKDEKMHEKYFTENAWVHIVESDGKLYMDGKEQKGE